MNYIKPENIKEYVSKNPLGIAGESKELSKMVNHFAELIVQECANIANSGIDPAESHLIGDNILEHFGVKE